MTHFHRSAVWAVAGLLPIAVLVLSTRGADEPKRGPLPPAEALKQFKLEPGLEVDLVLSEPVVRQPVNLSFDERGRLWVVQYLQYPVPAGLKQLSRDRFWRVVYDKVPPAPPHHFPGKDKVTIHEDTDGDGVPDRHKTFVEGLNIVSAVTRGRGGVWVLNPPYLLFYGDRNNDDVPDGPPEVHLQGFGLEDTHSVANSLRWGPDGWLYAAQGSTVSGDIRRPGSDQSPVHSLGQLIWRYHPETRRYEIFAEGGGNAFGVELDAMGRIYSGHNGGDTRGFHYEQGGYYQKGFEKHGPLSNPYAFGYFPAMKHAKVQRFTHTFVIDEGGVFPEPYAGKLYGAAPLQSHIVRAELLPDGSSFQTRDLGHALQSADPWFRPVDIKPGPDGTLYIADFYENQIAHLRHNEGIIGTDTGRVYRLRPAGLRPQKFEDLGGLTTAELVERLRSPNRWVRQTALRLIGDRRDRSALPRLREMATSETGQPALEASWALYQTGGFDEATALALLGHDDPAVRSWTVRLLADEKAVTRPVAARLASLARDETSVFVRVQLACSARRLPVADTLAIVRQLLRHSEDLGDVHQPLLLWWAIEAKCGERDAVVGLFREPAVWQLPLVEQQILERLARRFAQAGTRRDLLAFAELLKLATSDDTAKRLLTGFEQAATGRSLANLPKELVAALAARGGGSLSLRVRQGNADAIRDALARVADAKADRKERLRLVQVLGEIQEPRAVPVLLKVAAAGRDDELRQTALASLLPFADPTIGASVVAELPKLPEAVRPAALALVASRSVWAKQLLDGVDGGKVPADLLPDPVVRKLLLHRDEGIQALVRKHWGEVRGATTVEMRQQIDRLSGVVRGGTGNPSAGKKLFMNHCGKCHRLFDQGGDVGPELTTHKRDDVENLLLHVVNPSAEIREGFENFLVATSDGRTLSGFLAEQDDQVVVLRSVDAQDIVIQRSKIEEMGAVPQSLMPEGLLKPLSDQEVRDLFAYLRSSQPLRD